MNQPLFADVDTHLRSIGFQFHLFPGIGTIEYTPGLPANAKNPRLQQWLWSDAVYVPDVMRLDSYDDQRLLKLAAILHDVYASLDFVLHVLAILETRGRSGLVDTYLAKLTA